MVNSRLGPFAATPRGSGGTPLHPSGHPFSRSYGVNLPSSLTGVLSRASGSSPCPPVSVSGTGTAHLARGFSWQPGLGPFGTGVPSPSRLGLLARRICLPCTLHAWTGSSIPRRCLPFCVTPSLLTVRRWYGNLHPFPIAYAFRPRLRPRLTLGGRTFPRNPWAFGGQDSHLSFRYLRRHSHFRPLHPGFRSGFHAGRNAPLPTRFRGFRSFGGGLSPDTFSAPERSTSELLRTL